MSPLSPATRPFAFALPLAEPVRFEAAAQAQMECMLRDLRRVYHERNDALQEVTRAHHDALFRLAMAAEYRDDDTGAHIVRMGFLAEALAAGAPPDWAATLRKAAPMHDVGKIGIPDDVLKKPGRLSDVERAVMQRHPQIGADILGQSRIPLFALAAEVAASHHERWDGSGYPHGMRAESIPLAGRIVAIVDFFDALTMDRCYRPAFSDERALAMLNGEAGRAFDPRLATIFLRLAPQMIELRERVNARKPSFADLLAGPASLGGQASAAARAAAVDQPTTFGGL